MAPLLSEISDALDVDRVRDEISRASSSNVAAQPLGDRYVDGEVIVLTYHDDELATEHPLGQPVAGSGSPVMQSGPRARR
jgi:hypothetical protein